MTTWLRNRRIALVFLGAFFITRIASADCTLTNIGIVPLNELGLGSYSNNAGGLYPGWPPA